VREVQDEVDRANDLADRDRENSIYEARKLARPEQEQRDDGSWPHEDCIDCAEPIEPGRIRLGKIRCFACQDYLERARSR
jgi:hypothetical protein